MTVTKKREFKVMKDGRLFVEGQEASAEDVIAFDQKFPGLRKGKQREEGFSFVSEAEKETKTTYTRTTHEVQDVLSTIIDFRKIPERTFRYAGMVMVAIAGIASSTPVAGVITLTVLYMIYRCGQTEQR